MAWFTLYLWEAMELVNDPGDGSKIGLSAEDYPIFDEAFRPELNKKIINHYWNHEIGMETISMFKFAMARRLNEQMPLLNQVYKTTLLTFDPLTSISLTTTRDDTSKENVTRNSANSGTSTNTSGSRSVTFDTPQTALSGDEDYASGAADANSTATGQTNGTGNDTSETDGSANGTSTTTGYQGAVSDLLMKYRGTLLNVDMLVIDSLADCFMQIWRTDEEMLPQLGMGY